MFENTKVIRDFVVADFAKAKMRTQYGYGNKQYGKAESRQAIFNELQHLAQALVKSAAIDVEVRGEENLNIEGPVVYMASHKSVFDIIILLAILKQPVIFIGKKEVEKMPFVHKWFDALGCIYLDREDMRQALSSIIKGIEELKGGQSIVVFPEGTRNMSNDLRPFKQGCFKLVTKTKVPVVPIALSNTYKIFEEKKRIQKTKVIVNIGKPITTESMDKEALAQLPNCVEQNVRGLMSEIISK